MSYCLVSPAQHSVAVSVVPTTLNQKEKEKKSHIRQVSAQGCISAIACAHSKMGEQWLRKLCPKQ